MLRNAQGTEYQDCVTTTFKSQAGVGFSVSCAGVGVIQRYQQTGGISIGLELVRYEPKA